MFLGSLYCKQYGPRSDCSPIKVHTVYFQDEIKSEVDMNICSAQYFQDKNMVRIRVTLIGHYHQLVNVFSHFRVVGQSQILIQILIEQLVSKL